MNYNSKAHKDVVATRRQTVASLRARRLTEREIAKALIELRIVNPTTEQPWSVGTIHGDIEALNEEWQLAASADTGLLHSQLLAELDEVSRAAWRVNDFRTVLTAHKQKCEMLGLNAPTALQLDLLRQPVVVDSDFLEGVDLNAATVEELEMLEAAYRLVERLKCAKHPALLTA